MSTETQERVYELLDRIPKDGLAAVKQLFWTELNYDRASETLSRRNWPDRARDILADDPVLLAQYTSQFGSFDVIYAQLAHEQRGRGFPLSLTAERLAVNQLLENHPYALFVFSDTRKKHWHLVNVRYDKKATRQRVFRRIAVGPHERLRTASERVAMLDLATLSPTLFGLAPLDIQQRHDEAFNVEAVTGQFFQAYQQEFAGFRTDLYAQTQDDGWAHDFALQFLNRLMFLYYVQRKRWLGDDPDFVSNFWHAYRQVGRPTDTFFSEWLSVLFFEAFNNRFVAGQADRQYLPEAIRNALAVAPYLNGGLFIPNELDRQHQPLISDDRLAQIFAFLDAYNFTISEDTPLDQEVAVDPEMIGKVYESLVNVSEEVDERGGAGIFYTPRVEIDLMCRLSLVHWLVNQLGEQHKSLLYEVVFAFDPEDKERADVTVAEVNLWPRLYELLSSLIALDPACGSGSFLVGMLYVLDDLMARANYQLGYQQTPYERKKRIIGQSLYGVDVMDWAVHVAELRLWLQLVIDTDLEPAELQFRPLLPNLSFKIRCGDSLVQEVGGIDMALRKGSQLIPPHLKGRITQLKAEKVKFYNNDPACKYRNVQAVQVAELALFRDILEARTKAIDDRMRQIDEMLRPQVNLFGEVQTTQMGLERVSLEREMERLQADREQAARARDALRTVKDVPFVWDIAFVEIFAGDRSGCDIVIGNPPYVRQELIHDPRQAADEVSAQDKRAYKAKLARSVYTAWPLAFGYNWVTGQAQWQLDAKSDLYIYFYLHGLSLLNRRGVFCFITSNSWLDVGYGRDLQEFLVTRGQVKLVVDNKMRRSFASADINTIIVLLGSATDSKSVNVVNLENVARFVMLSVPFEQTLSPVIWEEIEEAQVRRTTPEYRVVPITQTVLLENGTEQETQEFSGDKWGGMYLRAPDIYWTVIEKGRDKLVRLDDIARVRRGFTTGANQFFYLSEAESTRWGIEKEFLSPVLRSPREVSTLILKKSNLGSFLFLCHKERNELQGTGALEYIRWGESQGFHQRATCRARARWWDLGSHEVPHSIWFKAFNDRFVFPYNLAKAVVSDRFYEIHLRDNFDGQQVIVALNNTFTILSAELHGRVSLGEGALDNMTYEAAQNLIVLPTLLPRGISVADREVLAVSKELDLPERRAMDEPVFDLLKLTQGERDALYDAVRTAVETRLGKAVSLR